MCGSRQGVVFDGWWVRREKMSGCGWNGEDATRDWMSLSTVSPSPE